MDAVEEGVAVGGLGEDVGDDGAADVGGVDAVFLEGEEVGLKDLDTAADGGGADGAFGENVTTEWDGLLEELDGFLRATGRPR